MTPLNRHRDKELDQTMRMYVNVKTFAPQRAGPFAKTRGATLTAYPYDIPLNDDGFRFNDPGMSWLMK